MDLVRLSGSSEEVDSAEADRALASTDQKISSLSNLFKEYRRVFYRSLSGHSRIHRRVSVPGRFLTEKIVNISLLYALAERARGRLRISAHEINGICKQHGCERTKRLATIIRENRVAYFIISKAFNGQLAISLTQRGIEAAENLLLFLKRKMSRRS